MKLQLKRSNVLTSGAAKEPTASQLEYGELAINYNSTDPAIFLKDSNNNVIRISGVGNIADDGQVELPASTTPPSNPEAGNLWFNSDEGRLYIYYVDANTSQWVDASPDSYDPSVVPDMSDPNYQAGTLDDRYNSSQVGTTAPAVTTRQEGALWWNSSANEGKLYVLYNDPAPDGRKKWVEASPYPDTSGFVTTTDLGNQQDITGGGGLTIDGNVGIGTTSPSTKVHIADAAAPEFRIVDTTNNCTGFMRPVDSSVRFGTGSNHPLEFHVNSSERVRIDSSGNVGIGTTSPDTDISGSAQGLSVAHSNVAFLSVENTAASGKRYTLYANDSGSLVTYDEDANTERMRIDSSGRLLVGTSTSRSNAVSASSLQIEGTDGGTGLSIIRNGGGNSAYLQIGSTGGSSVGSTTATPASAYISQIVFSGSDGSAMRPGAYITAANDQGSAWSAGDCPARLEFSTTADGASSPTERMRIDSSGNVLLGKSSQDLATAGFQHRGDAIGLVQITRDSGEPLQLNRLTNDGKLIEFRKDTASVVGAISIQGSDLGIEVNGSERVRIDSSGNLLIGRTSVGATGNGHSIRGGDSAIFSRNATGETVQICRNNSTGDLLQFRRNNVVCGEVVNTGATSVNYNTSSDYRLKENIAALSGGIDRVKGLKPSRFNFIAEPDRTVDGFLAHEAQTVVPECATGVKDWVDEDGNPVMQGIDQSKLVPLLTAALQEAIAKIETLEQRLSDAGIA